MQLAISVGIIGADDDVFDYGCGRGRDVRLLSESGIKAEGWDPSSYPSARKRSASIVNLGYVINVISDSLERERAIQEAWQLAKNALIVSARPMEEYAKAGSLRRYGDGFITLAGTFQKFFSQEELRSIGITVTP